MFSNDFGIDLGTNNTIIYRREKGIVLEEASVVACENYGTNTLLCAGRDAKEMLGRTPDTVSVTCPIVNSVIADFDKTVMMLRDFLRRVRVGAAPITAVVTVPCRATQVEQRAVVDALRAAGVKYVPFVVEKPIAAGIGSGLSVFEPKGRMVVDIGAGSTEISILSLGGIVSVTSTTVAGNRFDSDIVEYIRRVHGVLIGNRTAETLKISIGSVFEKGQVNFMTVAGRNLIRGLPVNIALSSDDIREAISESVDFIVDQIRLTLEKLPLDMSSDIIDNGITLVGGGSLLPGWEELLAKKTGVVCVHSATPLQSVAIGIGNSFVHRDLIKHGAEQQIILA